MVSIPSSKSARGSRYSGQRSSLTHSASRFLFAILECYLNDFHSFRIRSSVSPVQAQISVKLPARFFSGSSGCPPSPCPAPPFAHCAPAAIRGTRTRIRRCPSPRSTRSAIAGSPRQAERCPRSDDQSPAPMFASPPLRLLPWLPSIFDLNRRFLSQSSSFFLRLYCVLFSRLQNGGANGHPHRPSNLTPRPARPQPPPPTAAAPAPATPSHTASATPQ